MPIVARMHATQYRCIHASDLKLILFDISVALEMTGNDASKYSTKYHMSDITIQLWESNSASYCVLTAMIIDYTKWPMLLSGIYCGYIMH